VIAAQPARSQNVIHARFFIVPLQIGIGADKNSSSPLG